MSSRLAQLAGDRSGERSDALVAEAVADLSTAMEELRVADEELRQQNEELVAARQSVDEEQPPSSLAAGPLRILLVEDHADTAFTISQLLRHVGHDVVLAQSIAGALERAGSEPFDLLISDLGLPDGSGWELMSKLREQTGIQGIAYSGYGTQDDIRRSREAGFARHLTKPVTLDQILDAIGQLSFQESAPG